MLGGLVRTAVALLVLASGGYAAFAEKRVALVIGNAAYQKAPELTNPKNDAEDMAAALKALGFTVILGLDLDKRAMDRKIIEFESALSGADAGVFHYSGHGLQVAGVNYLVPVDAELASAAALRIEAVRLDFVQETMEREAKTNILFLDACRNNPLARNLARALGTRSADIGRGFAAAEAGVGTLISFSTQPGNVALDGSGRNSPYSGSLVKTIGIPDKDLSSILIAVRNEVLAATSEKQVPWEHSALRAPFYFKPAAPASASPPSGAQPPLSEAAQAWRQIKDLTDISVFDAFRRQYGKSNALYDTLAEQRMAALRATQVAIIAPQKPVVSPPEDACDGLLVAVSQPSAKPCIKPGSGEGFKDCRECPEMVVVPEGSFAMGSPESEPERESNEGPQHRVTIPKPFTVGRFAVTFAEWDACVTAGGCGGYRPSDQGWGRADRPVINVSWNDAKAYVDWLSKKTGQPYRLLSEAEREYVTRAGTNTPFWWGPAITPIQANYNGNYTSEDGGLKGEYLQKTVPVNSFKPNPWGLYQVQGNVWEWTEDCLHPNYHGAPDDGSAWTTGDCKSRVLRGGSWYSHPKYLRAAFRADIYFYPRDRSSLIGFRVAKTPNP